MRSHSNAYFVETERRIWTRGDNPNEPNTEDEIFFALIFAHTENGARTVFRRARQCPYEYADNELTVLPIASGVDRPIGVADDDDPLWEQVWEQVYNKEIAE